jgi:serine protease Do
MRRLIILLLLCGFPSLATVAWGQSDANPDVNLRRTVVVDVVQRTKGAVVNISAAKEVIRRVPLFANNPFWEGMGPSTYVQVPGNSLGSGFIVHADGYVVTNNHVIDRATAITVELADGRKLPATLISSDPEADLAILKITDSKPFPTLDLGDNSDLMIGEPAIAVGNPFGYSHTVSTGIISALHRDLGDENNKTLTDLIQTDAAINPGNSGGPLLNAYGQVIGINTAIRSDAQNIGFAIGVDRLRDLIPVLMNPTEASKVNVPLKLAEKRTLSEPDHIAVQIVNADDPHRVVTQIGGQTPTNIVDAYAILLRARAGDRLAVSYADGQSDTLLASAVVHVEHVSDQAQARLGLTLEQVTPDVARKYDLATVEGLMVRFVSSNSVAAAAGFEPGDVIVGLGRYRVTSMDDLSDLLPRLPEKGRVPVGIYRGDQRGYLIMEFDQ